MLETGGVECFKNHPEAVVLAVEETLRGDPLRGRLSVSGGVWIDQSERCLRESNLKDWKVRSHRLLIAINHRAGRSPTSVTAIDLDADPLAAVRGDLVVLKNSGDVIQAARDEIARIHPGSKPMEGYEEPSAGYHDEGDRFYAVMVIVPADKRVEDAAHTAINVHDEQCADAVSQLRYFRTEENIQLLKGLLGNQDANVRADAHSVLKDWWGLDVAYPGVSEPVAVPVTSAPYKVFVMIPSKLKVERSNARLGIGDDMASLQKVSLLSDNPLFLGMRSELRVWIVVSVNYDGSTT